eukprot:15130167-Alexandrium_andersonii.AAC.1
MPGSRHSRRSRPHAPVVACRGAAPARPRVRQHPCTPCVLAPRRCAVLGPSPTPGPASAAQPRC